MRVLIGNQVKSIDAMTFKSIADKYKFVVVDLGTGDGQFVYRNAKQNPEVLYIGIDSTADNMMELSVKAAKKLSKGGVSNLLFVVGTAEELPAEMNAIADKVYVNLPWGSLRDGLIKGSEDILSSIKNISKSKSTLEVCIAYSDLYESNEIQNRQLPELSVQYIETILKAKYSAFGIHIRIVDLWDNDKLKSIDTKWAKKLAFGKSRAFYYIKCLMNVA